MGKSGQKGLQSTSPTHPSWTFHYITILVYMSSVRSVGFLAPIWLLLGIFRLGFGGWECDVHYVVPGFPDFPRLLGCSAPLGVCLFGILMFMSELAGFDDGELRRRLAEQVREHNSTKIYELIAQLEPHALGFTGPINPGLVRAYLEALKNLGQLWRVFDKPEVVEVAEDVRPELAAEAARVEVLRVLGVLAAKGDGSVAS